jgi:type I restriction enzyme M protein
MNKDQLKSDFWRAADALRANSNQKVSEYATSALGIIFFKPADNKYKQYEEGLLAEYQALKEAMKAVTNNKPWAG